MLNKVGGLQDKIAIVILAGDINSSSSSSSVRFGKKIRMLSMVTSNPRKQAELEFPAEWTYTIIGTDKSLMTAAVASVFSSEKITLRDSKKSSGGKYISLEIRVQVQSKEQKDRFYHALASSRDIKMVL